jgi:nitrate/nitrite transport system permease protein
METAAVSGEISGTPLSERISTLARALLPPVLGMLILLGIWYVATFKGGSIPGPGKTWDAAAILFSDPFYRNGPNDQGIGWNVLSSLQRVGIGFGFAALVGIPLGFILGRSAISLGHDQSDHQPAAPGFAAGLAADWPAGLPEGRPGGDLHHFHLLDLADDHEHRPGRAARAAGLPERGAGAGNLSEWKVVTKILFPAVLPYMLTGIRLSIGTAWLVIVAAEMLTGGVGIGFWVWDEWNNLKVEHIIIAIFVIGIVGLILEQMLIVLAKKLTKESA